MPRCRSQFCVTVNGLKGREFEPPKEAKDLSAIWCEPCIRIGTQLQFFSTQTANMIRNKFETYEDTALPNQVKLFMRQFVSELLLELGEKL